MNSKKIILRVATGQDCEDLLGWRNHPSVRRYFFNNKPVARDEHEKWFSSKIKERSTNIYIAWQGRDKVGVVRFETDRSCTAHVSVNLNPDFFGKKIGSAIIKRGTEKWLGKKPGPGTVIAEIKKSNAIAQKAFSSAGYKLAEKAGDKVIYKMEGFNV